MQASRCEEANRGRRRCSVHGERTNLVERSPPTSFKQLLGLSEQSQEARWSLHREETKKLLPIVAKCGALVVRASVTHLEGCQREKRPREHRQEAYERDEHKRGHLGDVFRRTLPCACGPTEVDSKCISLTTPRKKLATHTPEK